MDKERGLPIAAYLGALVALALTSAFIAMVAIIIWLPPKPPDVMRSDEVAEHFQAGYDYTCAEERTLPNDNMIWRIQSEAPGDEAPAPEMHLAQLRLARSLDLDMSKVRFAAENVRQDGGFMFAVRDVEELKQQMEEAAREIEAAIREAEWNTRKAEETWHEAAEATQAAEAAVRAAEAATRVALSAGREDEALLEAEEAAREAADEARQREDEAREAKREAHAAERQLRLDRVRIVADGVSVDPDIEIGEDGSVHVGSIEIHAPAPPHAPAVAGAEAPDPPAPPDPPLPETFMPAPAGVMLISGFEIAAQLSDGRWLVMRQGRNWAELGWILRAALIIGGALAVLSFLAILFARRLTRPIRSFADAVQAVGVNPQSEPVREEGPLELRGAARAVNTMQARLRALIADRTKTLAAVAHDMRTPLMRLRLAAENVTAEQRERMAKEIEEVEALVASFIAFARDDPAEEARVRLDLSALLQSIADDRVEARKQVTFEGEERLIITGQSLGLKRLFNNLVENALKYGGCARIKLRRNEGAVVVDVEDDGPGVPAEQRESVFEPFVRLENGEARSGAGLGLPAARSIARAHGGDVVILDAEQGALVRVSLPG